MKIALPLSFIILLLSCNSEKQFEQVKLFYPSGKLSATGGMKDSLRQGKWTGYYESGEKESEGNYKDDEPVGKAFFYYEDGKIKRETDFANGRIHKEVSWYNNGAKQEEGYYAIDKFERVGKWVYYDSLGKHTDTIDHDITPYEKSPLYFQF
jgi:antitoxin component YwqK of YwqJK toxin-antitoxin module